MNNRKKSNYAYVLVPLIALIIFVVIYIRFDKGYEQDLANKAAAVRAAKEKKVEADNLSRQEAVKIAIADSEARKKAKKEKDEADQKRRDDRQAAFQMRDKAQTDAGVLREKVARLRKDVEGLKEDIKKIEQDKSTLAVEKDSVDQVTAKAEANAKGLTDVLEKIKAADTAAAANAAAAARAAAAKKS
jgi:colicin import membrane protein